LEHRDQARKELKVLEEHKVLAELKVLLVKTRHLT
jgi:hypothetical protein